MSTDEARLAATALADRNERPDAAFREQAERLTRMTAQFRALHAIGVALTSSLELDRVLNLILEKATGLVGAEHGSLRLLDPDTDELVLKAHLGEGWTQEVQAYTFRPGHGITGWVAEHRRPYLCADAHGDPQNVVLFQEMRSGVALPLLTHDDAAGEMGSEAPPAPLLGVLLLESTRRNAFDQEDVELLAAMAQQAVIAIQNATQHQRLRAMHRALQDEQARRVAAEKWSVMGQAATALAHRINNLVGILPASTAEIRRSLETIPMPEGERAWLEENLCRIERNGTFVLRLADALFRPFQDTGRQTQLDVNLMLNQALLAADMPPDVEVICDFEEALPPVECNSLLVDIFLELITNARRAMESQARKSLTLRTRLAVPERAHRTAMQPSHPGPAGPPDAPVAARQHVVVEVRDTGVGITPEQMPRLWELFRVEPSSPAPGLGFGLWWVRTFLERQGGTITCDSEPGAGTTFTVRLPPGSTNEEREER